MRALLQLTLANIRSYLRDRAAVFWTLAFPLIFILLFGFIFQAGNFQIQIGWADDDTTADSSAALLAAFKQVDGLEIVDGHRGGDQARRWSRARSTPPIIVPAGFGERCRGPDRRRPSRRP